jgi:hypothetical protein
VNNCRTAVTEIKHAFGFVRAEALNGVLQQQNAFAGSERKRKQHEVVDRFMLSICADF